MPVDRISYYARAGAFIVKKHLVGYKVNPNPTFDVDARAAFEGLAQRAKTYLEFGSGGSTIFASRFVSKLVSVETDPVFMKAVRRSMPPTAAETHFLTPNIGLTHLWGAPVFAKPTPARVRRWKAYPEAPWNLLRNQQPDLVLVDGRFRVACVLTALLNVSRDSIILVDDYAYRDYSAINPFVELIAAHGNMVEVRKSASFDRAACTVALDGAYENFM